MQDPPSFGSEKLLSVPTSDYVSALQMQQVCRRHKLRAAYQLCSKGFQTTQTSAMIACHIFALHYTLSVNTVGDSSTIYATVRI